MTGPDGCYAPGQDVEVWAHFGGGFDYRFALDWLVKQAGPMDWLTQGSLILQIRGRTRQGVRFRLNDSIRLLPDGLDKVGAALGYEKLPMKYEHDDECERYRAYELYVDKLCVRCLAGVDYGASHLVRYWRRDLEILWRGIERAEDMLSRVGVTKMRVTLASNAAAAIVERAGRPETPWGDGKTADVDREAEGAYHGGRVEVFQSAAKYVRVYDVRSSYPAACVLDGPLPWRYRRSGRTGYKDGRLGVVNARVVVPDHVRLPILPYRHKTKLYFPTGSWRGTFTYAELQAAVEVGAARLTHVYWWHEWDGTAAIGEFMAEAWEERAKATDKFEAYFWKILMNACYGKLIEAREKERVVVNPESLLGLIPYHPGMPIYHQPVYRQPTARCAAAGAYVTARARLRLWRYMRAAQERGDLLYCDTDSVFVGNQHMDMPVGEGLGDLKSESAHEEGLFWAPKMYALRNGDAWKVKAKGLPGIGIEDLRALILGGKYAFTRTQGAREMYKSGQVGFTRKNVAKRHLGGRPKRHPDGRPWDVRELEERWPLARQLNLGL